jgi:homoaconitase/3-isopropylmalate dehydratase large subunit
VGKTLSEKVWDRHVVHKGEGNEPDLLYIDLHLIHEVTSPQAFDGLRMEGRQVRRPDLTLATADHNVPTKDIDKPVADEISRRQLEDNSRRSMRTARSSGSPSTRWAIRTRALCTSSDPSKALRSPA